MTRDDYRAILDQALKAENGLRLPFHDWQISGCVRAQLYRLRERLRRKEFCCAYDCLSFRLVDADLCIIRNAKVPPVDDAISSVRPVPMDRGEAANLPTWPRKQRRAASW